MRTITFYSYKGGVGRSLVLANLAQRLVEFGKSVCMLDFDLEAPGLPFKFDAEKILAMNKKGVVDFVTEYQNTLKPPQTLDGDYYIRLNESNKYQAPLHLIIAGNTNKREYWKNLAGIDWKEMFYTEHGRGYRLMLHLKALIEKELKPDYLLIDSRTGVTETSGITLSILADEVVVVAANNQENIYGSKLIMKGVWDTALEGKKPPMHFILSRVPFSKEPDERLKEKDRVDGLLKDFIADSINLYEPNIYLLHSDRDLEVEEKLKISEFKRQEEIHIGQDYRTIFRNIFSKHFNPEEKSRLGNEEKASELYADYQMEQDKDKKLEIINKCIDLDPSGSYYSERGYILATNFDKLDEALEDYSKASELNPDDWTIYFMAGIAFNRKGKNKELIEFLNKGIKYYSELGILYFIRSWYYENQGLLKEVEKDLLKAISLHDGNRYNSSLAKFYFKCERYEESYDFVQRALQASAEDADTVLLLSKLQYVLKNSKDDFYLNLERALAKYDGLDFNQAAFSISIDEFFRPFLNEERFLRILYKYNIKMRLAEKPEKGNNKQKS